MPDFHHGVQIVEQTAGLRRIRTIATGVIGVVGTAPTADETAFPLDTPVLIAGDQVKASLLGDTGTLPGVMDAIFSQIGAMIVVVRVTEDADPATQATLAIGDVVDGVNTGMQALKDAESNLGIKPRILAAPGIDSEQAVATALATLAEDLRGFAYVGIAATTKEDAVTYRDNFASRRMMLIWPEPTAWDNAAEADVTVYATAYAIGLRAKIDNDTGWHKSLSNVAINGLTGLSKSVDFDLTNPNTAANFLNSNEITTLIRQEGFRFWGNRTCADAANEAYSFEVASRTSDVLADSIAAAMFGFIDKPMSKALIDEILKSINAKFRSLEARGYILGANAYVNEELNGDADLAAGKLTISYDFTAVPPLEQIELRQTITDTYVATLLAA